MPDKTAYKIIGGMLALIFLLALGAVRSSWPENEAVGVEAEQQTAEAVHKKEIVSRISPAVGKRSPATDRQAAEKKKERSEEASEFWPPLFGYRFKVTDSLLVLFTAILAWKTAGLDKATRRLWEAGERQISIASAAVRAAETSAAAAMAAVASDAPIVHCANVVISHYGTSIYRKVEPSSSPNGKLDTIFSNIGNTSAELLEICINVFFGTVLPDIPDYSTSYKAANGTIINVGASCSIPHIFRVSEPSGRRTHCMQNSHVYLWLCQLQNPAWDQEEKVRLHVSWKRTAGLDISRPKCSLCLRRHRQQQ